MKLESLYIVDYRVLQDLTLQFARTHSTYRIKTQREYALDFLAGVNGSGKTTALQALGRIFAWLINADRCPIEFDLTYTLGRSSAQSRRQVHVTNILARTELAESADAIFYQEDGGEWQSGKLPQSLLPDAVVLYTTGSEREWEQALAIDSQPLETEDATTEQLPDDSIELPGHRPDFAAVDAEEEDREPDEKLLFVRSRHTPLLALCGSIASQWYATDGREILQKVLDDVHIQALAGFTLRLRVHRSLTPAYQQRIVSRLESAANRIILNGSDRILQFDMAQQPVKPSIDRDSIFTIYSSPIDLFRHLLALYNHREHYEAPLQEVSLFFQKKRQLSVNEQTGMDDRERNSEQGMLQLFEWLSDGERSFLARMALFTLFRSDELLILLDEPEVHFNDVWKREIVHTLDKIMSGFASHALITTHSSIALTDVHSTDILILRRKGQHTSDSGNQQRPGIETFGADPSDILVHVFGTLSANGEHSRRFIQNEMIELDSAEELEEFSLQIAPGYWRYRIQLEAERQRRLFS